MDKELIAEKIESLRHCIKRVEDKRPTTVEELMANDDLQDIITVNLARAVQGAVDIAVHIISDSEAAVPATMAESFEVLNQNQIISVEVAERMKKAVGFRNTVIHNYIAIDWNIVFNICQNNLQDFKHYIAAIDKLL